MSIAKETLPAIAAGPIAVGALNTIKAGAKIYSQSALYSADNSLIGYTHAARVEPLCVVGLDMMNYESMPEILQSLLSLFSGYYLQGIALNNQVNGVHVARELDKLNPNRKGSLIGAGQSGYSLIPDDIKQKVASAFESWRNNSFAYKHRLPTTDNPRAIAFENEQICIGLESGLSHDDYLTNKNAREQELHDLKIKETQGKLSDAEKNRKDELAKSSAAMNKQSDAVINNDSLKNIREISDLSVGKLLNVTIGGGTDKDGKEIRGATIPVSIRLMVNALTDSVMVSLLSNSGVDNSMKERYHAWRSGRIEFIRDLIFCQDLIDENKKAMINDKTGIHSEIIRRVTNTKLAGLQNKDPSLNVASNLYVISEVTKAAVERKLGGHLKSPLVRNKIFESGYAMIIVVVDRQWDMVTFYYRGVAAATTMSLRDLKIANKGSGPDIGDILKAYQLGNSPQM